MRHLLHQPGKVFWICLIFGTISLLFNGTLLHLYKLHRDKETLVQQIAQTRAQSLDLDRQVSMAKDPSFIERQALNLYDLAQEHDLVFVFSDE